MLTVVAFAFFALGMIGIFFGLDAWWTVRAKNRLKRQGISWDDEITLGTGGSLLVSFVFRCFFLLQPKVFAFRSFGATRPRQTKIPFQAVVSARYAAGDPDVSPSTLTIEFENAKEISGADTVVLLIDVTATHVKTIFEKAQIALQDATHRPASQA